VLLGFISLFVFANVQTQTRWSRVGISAFLFSFVTTEVLLVLNAAAGLLHFDVPYFIQLLLFGSLFFPVGIACMLPGLRTEKESIPENAVQPVIAV
ncbi:MAG TPA: hypothetical protein VFL47_10220, partial [Flavisolibacter sp.]|nr:hypothetical protein [Flavisolibacter sp.]